ncbi:hypothetical protein GDO78_013584 [Eleutherodactylus coqui]|uniref:Uncharacterized protein n=1 Tax=Eleutherodactylus coqui TaxID=57060 RepID=A0A8J6EQV6_ELECQ|nr:hypothetical protein GDO78_013584 [Eleutherodactylus coqui]
MHVVPKKSNNPPVHPLSKDASPDWMDGWMDMQSFMHSLCNKYAPCSHAWSAVLLLVHMLHFATTVFCITVRVSMSSYVAVG